MSTALSPAGVALRTVPPDVRDTLAGLAERARSTAQPAPSPCVSVCRMDESTALCVGCYRTIDEIMAWGPQGDSAHRRGWQQVLLRAGLPPMA